jgi:hypothetical protein
MGLAFVKPASDDLLRQIGFITDGGFHNDAAVVALIHQRTSTSETPSHTDLPTLGGIGSDMGIAPTVLGCNPKRLLM